MIFLKYSLCSSVPSRSAGPSLPSRSARPSAFISSSPITVPAASFARPLAFCAAPGSCSATLFLLCPRPPLLLMAFTRVCDGKTSIGRAGASKNLSWQFVNRGENLPQSSHKTSLKVSLHKKVSFTQRFIGFNQLSDGHPIPPIQARTRSRAGHESNSVALRTSTRNRSSNDEADQDKGSRPPSSYPHPHARC